jgi:hypothetical protein
MKKNLGMFFGLSRCGVGAVLLGLCAFTPVSRAGVVIDNLGDGSNGGINGALAAAQVFTMSGSSGDINSLTLDLVASVGGSAEVDLYSVSGSAPGSLIADFGTVSVASSGNIAVSLISYPLLSSGTSYAIVLQPSSSSTSWEYTTTASSGGSGSLGGLYYEVSGNWYQYTSGNYLQMSLSTTPVPEVPMTGMVMGFGALAIALGRRLRKAVSSVV